MLKSRFRRVLTVTLVGVAILAGCRKPQAEQTSPARPVSQAAATFTKIREPAVAGLFYPKDKEQLAQSIDKLLAKAEPAGIGGLRGLVCPHAGYEFSGQTAAIAYRQLRGRDVETVVVMAPSHYADFRGASIADADAYATPLGPVPVSSRAAELIKEQRSAGGGPFVCNPPCEVSRPAWWRQASKEVPPFGEDTPHTWEHALEVQLPFMQRTLKGFAIVPIVFGRADPQQVAEALSGAIDDKTVVVASSDLSHYHPYETARKLDDSCVRAICDLDFKRMQGEEACGKLPILTLMYLAKAKGWKARLLDYRNSGDVTGDKSGVVGYAAIAFFEPGESSEQGGTAEARSDLPVRSDRIHAVDSPMNQATADSGQSAAISADDGRFLWELAVKSVDRVVRQGKLPDVDATTVPEAVRDPRACFVTLTKHGQLRGCIGCILPVGPLWQEVMRRAEYAATQDPRFPPVDPSESDDLDVSVSVLSLPRKLEFQSPDDLVAKLRPGIDGVVLRVGSGEATYLPQVWEQLPEPKAFLAHLSQKAGLEPSAWRSPAAVVLVYQVQEFKQEDKVAR